MMSTPVMAATAGLIAMVLGPGPGTAHDYPTVARAEYVFACMATNGQTPLVLRQCACSIDAIAERLPYDQYERVETVMTMQLLPGERIGMFRDAPWVRELLGAYQKAQAEANLRCF